MLDHGGILGVNVIWFKALLHIEADRIVSHSSLKLHVPVSQKKPPSMARG